MTLFEGHIFDSRRKVKSRKVSYVVSHMQCYLIFSIGSKRSLGSGTILFMFVSFMTIYILCGQQRSFFKGTFHGGSHFVTRVWVITVLIWVIFILQRSCIHICFHYNVVVCNIVPYHSTGIKWLTSGVTQSPCLGGPPGYCRNDDRNYGFGFWWRLNEIVLIKGLAWCLSPSSVNRSYHGFSVELHWASTLCLGMKRVASLWWRA